MSHSIDEDLLAAHADTLLAGHDDYRERYAVLFTEELESLAPLFTLAAQLHDLYRERAPLRPEYRADLKADLLAQARQDQLRRRREGWRWAAIGASVTVAGVIAAAAWRGNYHRGAM